MNEELKEKIYKIIGNQKKIQELSKLKKTYDIFKQLSYYAYSLKESKKKSQLVWELVELADQHKIDFVEMYNTANAEVNELLRKTYEEEDKNEI